MLRPFRLVDVFSSTPYQGNPLAVVLDGSGLPTERMQRFAAWMNLSETTFVLAPSDPSADYRVRIFTPTAELPFAGHPTLGTCHCWLDHVGVDDGREEVVQECGAGLVRIRRRDDGLAFAAPPLRRTGPVDTALVERIAVTVGIDLDDVTDATWADNGPGWVALLLTDARTVLAARPGFIDLDIGLVGPHPAGGPAAFEVRAFFPKDGAMVEDPVTGSLNAAVGQWLLAAGIASAPYAVRQGTALGRAGRVLVDRDGAGHVWVGGATVACIDGTVDL